MLALAQPLFHHIMLWGWTHSLKTLQQLIFSSRLFNIQTYRKWLWCSSSRMTSKKQRKCICAVKSHIFMLLGYLFANAQFEIVPIIIPQCKAFWNTFCFWYLVTVIWAKKGSLQRELSLSSVLEAWSWVLRASLLLEKLHPTDKLEFLPAWKAGWREDIKTLQKKTYCLSRFLHLKMTFY